MKESRYFYVPQAHRQAELPADEATHAVRVLRLCEGDEIFLMDGCGTFYRAQVTLATHKCCAYRIIEAMPQQRAWGGRVHVAVAPTKMIDRIEWLAEKATEVGIDGLTFLNCVFSERRVIRTERMEKIVVAAAKQSRKPWMPQVDGMTPFNEFVARPRTGLRCIAHCYDEIPRQDLFSLVTHAPNDEEVTILVGPEGDFSVQEVRLALQHGFIPVSLGTSRLRTETAALAAVMMAHLAKRITPGETPSETFPA